MLFNLYLTFLKIGIFSFGGGYAALAIIQNEVVYKNGWLGLSEFNDLITISQMTPGPIAINSATFVGTKIAGHLGALVATLGFITPSLIIVTFISYIYIRYRQLKVMDSILKFMRPAVVALIFMAAIPITKTAFFGEANLSLSNFNPLIFFLSIVSFYFIYKKKIDPIKIMVASGFIYCGINLIIF